MKRLAVIAALAGELKPLVRGWESSSFERGVMYTQRREELEIVAVYGGMGRAAAAAAFLRATQEGRLDAVISVGWAGALSPRLVPGKAYTVAKVVDGGTGERYVTESSPDAGGATLQLVTMKRVVLREEKRRVADDFGAELVDMEAATVARLERVHDIAFYCCKAVSDGVDETLPDMNPFIGGDGRMKTAAFVSSVLMRPQYWPALVRMGKNSASGAVALAEAVERLAVALPAEQVKG